MKIKDTIASILEAISTQNKSTRLLAVSKGHPASAIKEAYLAGQRAFGENYLKEAIDKILALSHFDIEWHFTGRIQSNKTKLIAQHFDWVQTVANGVAAQRLNAARAGQPLNILIQFNVSNEAQKSGVTLEQIKVLAEIITTLPNLCLRGLMIIPEKTNDQEKLKNYFLIAKHAFNELQLKYPAVDTLSMGMSSDSQLAITCGSTMVRIGTVIFGKREKKIV